MDIFFNVNAVQFKKKTSSVCHNILKWINASTHNMICIHMYVYIYIIPIQCVHISCAPCNYTKTVQVYIYMDSIHTVKLHFPDGGFFRPGLAIVFQIVGMEIMESLTGPGGLMNLTFPALQDVIDLEARVIDLCIPFGWHHLRESPGKVGNKNSMANYIYMGVSKNSGTPKSSILIGFSIVNHPFWGTPIFGNTHINTTHLVGSPSLSLEAERRTLQGINISHLGKRKIIFNMPFWGDMLVPWRVAFASLWGLLAWL